MKLNESQLKDSIKRGIAQSLKIDPNKLPADLTPSQAATALDTTPNSLATDRCLKRSNIPYFKLGKRIRYPLFGIIQYKLDNLSSYNRRMM